MALTGAMSAGISGLKAHMEALNVVGNNVANVNTYGYKAGRVTFRESIYSTQSAGSAGTATVGGTNPRQTGYGTSVGTIDLDMTSQSLESTGFPLDAAIQGDGFFLVGPKGLTFDSPDDFKSLTLSRVGDFKFDSDGYLVDGGGNVVYGFSTCNAQLNADGTVGDIEEDPGIDGNAISTVLAPIRLPLAAVGSTDPNATIKPGAALYPGFTDGNKTNTDPEKGNDPGDTTGDTINYSSLQIDENGRITCVNDDTKEPVVVGYIAIGKVENPNGLTHTEGPYYNAGDAAGDLNISAPNSAVTGYLNNQEPGGNNALDPGLMLLSGSQTSLMTGFLEQSGTDLAQEFANMIVYQRGYQANTRIVTVTDSMLEELVNMKR